MDETEIQINIERNLACGSCVLRFACVQGLPATYNSTVSAHREHNICSENILNLTFCSLNKYTHTGNIYKLYCYIYKEKTAIEINASMHVISIIMFVMQTSWHIK